MRVECPYCSVSIDVVSLHNHVRASDDAGHGEQGTVPFEGSDNPWNLRLNVSVPREAETDPPSDVPTVEYVRDEVRRGRCPACERGVLGLKGGDGIFSRGRRRLACPNCAWESPEWIEIV